MLSHMYPSPVNWTGGIFVHEQVKALVARGHDVRVVSPKGWAPPLVPRWQGFREIRGVDFVEGVPVLYPRKLSLPGGRLGHRNCDAMLRSVAKPLRRIHERWSFDVLHAHMLVPDGWAAAWMGTRLGVPVVATAHRADVLDVPAQGPGSRRRVEEAVAGIDQVCAVSRAIADAAEGLAMPRRPVEVVPNGADTDVFMPRDAAEARARLGVPDDGPVVSYVGKLVPRKGVDHLIEAMGILARRSRPSRSSPIPASTRRGAPPSWVWPGASTGWARCPTTRWAGRCRVATSSCSPRSARASRRWSARP